MSYILHLDASGRQNGSASREASAAQAAQLSSESGLTIAVDVGHSKTRPGAFSARGRGEFEFNLDTARVIDVILESAGATCLIINETGTLQGLAERPQRALRLGADVFISIHHDSVNEKYKKTWIPPGQSREWEYSDKFRGYSVFCSEKNPMAEQSRNL
ncbi:MAG: N-acetylmuramoyl-L-alanine amidase, partial [Verrucomicrobiota bacterium]